MTVSIKDVAKRAGVAIGTVSRVFNHYPDVLPETQAKVRAAAIELNYSPNVNARSLSAKRPPNICLIGAEMTRGGDLATPLLQHMQGILKYAGEHGLELCLHDVAPAEQSRMTLADYCRLHAISGAILTGIKTDDPYFASLLSTQVCVVGIDLPVTGKKAGWVSVDNRAAAREGMEGLYDRCGGDILIIAGRKNAAVNDERLSGIRDALMKKGLEPDAERCLYADFDRRTAMEKTRAWLKAHGAPRGIFCLSDLMAAGAMQAVREAGFTVPGDVKILGFDGMGFTAVTVPSLSTVKQDFRAIGYEAAALLHGLMTGRESGGHRILPHQILWRASTD